MVAMFMMVLLSVIGCRIGGRATETRSAVSEMDDQAGSGGPRGWAAVQANSGVGEW
jgi:hypothetical protein